MEKFIALVRFQDHVLTVVNPDDNSIRVFDDEKLAEEVARIFETDYKIVTEKEFNDVKNQVSPPESSGEA